MAASFTGKLLVANPEMRDPNFYRSVVLLFDHSEDGAVGMVLNQPSDEPVADHLPAWSDRVADPAVVFVGGPVRNEIAVGVAEWPGAPEDWNSLFADIGFVDLAESPDPHNSPRRIRVYSGYSGWDAGQLEVEMAIDSWFVVDPEVSDVFGDPEHLWERVLGRQSGRLSLYAQYPHDLSNN
jgi:putative transcriptional regulator